MAASTILASFMGQFPKRGFVSPADSGNQPYAAGHGPVALQLDAMISEAPDYQATATQSQVEDGSVISDHVTIKPLKLTIHGIVTDTPVSLIREFSTAFQNPSPSKAAFTFLTKLYNDRIPFDFVGGLNVYKSMVITAFTPTNTAETGDALRFVCTMEQVRTVSSQVITTKKASGKSSQGSQPLTKITANEGTGLHDSFQSISPTRTVSVDTTAAKNFSGKLVGVGDFVAPDTSGKFALAPAFESPTKHF
jgi:hypothetical protein